MRSASLAALLCLVPMSASGQDQDASVREVLAANARLEAAIAAGDADAIGAYFSPEFRLQNSANRILSAEQVVRQFRSGSTRFASYERNVEAAYSSGDVVVLMGEEKVTPSGAGTKPVPVARRFTSVWRKTGAGWRQIARQSTNVQPSP